MLALPANAQSAIDRFCEGECRLHLFTGTYVNDAMIDIFVDELIPPWKWDYQWNEKIYGIAVSKMVASYFDDTVKIEPEFGFAIRTGEEDTQEIWGAIYVRFDSFPWNDFLYTSIGISTGINYAFDVTERERERARGSETGSKILHYLSPEIAFALPRHPEQELVFRFHHRSGGYGAINGTYGGAHYGTMGVRFRF